MITALLHTVTISFSVVAVSRSGSAVCVFPSNRDTKDQLLLLEAIKTTYRCVVSFMFMALRWQGHMMVWAKKKSCKMPCIAWSGNKTKGLLSKPMHAHWAEDLAFCRSVVHHQDWEPATDRVWFRQMDGQTCVVCCKEGRTTEWNFTAGFEIMAKPHPSVCRLIKNTGTKLCI